MFVDFLLSVNIHPLSPFLGLHWGEGQPHYLGSLGMQPVEWSVVAAMLMEHFEISVHFVSRAVKRLFC